MAIMDATGDTRIMWDPDDKTSVDIAREAFESAKKKSMLIYRVEGNGDRGEVVRDFDPEDGRMIIARPQMRGG